jgi:hypothetical protein
VIDAVALRQPATFGALLVPLVYVLARRMGTSQPAAVLAAGIVLFDGAVCDSHLYTRHSTLPYATRTSAWRRSPTCFAHAHVGVRTLVPPGARRVAAAAHRCSPVPLRTRAGVHALTPPSTHLHPRSDPAWAKATPPILTKPRIPTSPLNPCPHHPHASQCAHICANLNLCVCVCLSLDGLFGVSSTAWLLSPTSPPTAAPSMRPSRSPAPPSGLVRRLP